MVRRAHISTVMGIQPGMSTHPVGPPTMRPQQTHMPTPGNMRGTLLGTLDLALIALTTQVSVFMLEGGY